MAATDLERLVVQLSADIKQYQNNMQQAMGVTNRQARAIENRWNQVNKRMDTIGRAMASSILTPLAGIGAALGAREVLRYADAWAKAKNSLAIAGVVGDEQVVVLERIFTSAQANAAPLEAMATLFGRAAQAGDNLGASQEEILKFTDGVGVALKVAGTSAEAARGALVQLGQALGQSRVMAEEFNSVNEGARPILIAVANGFDEAGGSVSKLKQLVNDGKVSGQQFFQAFLRGLPTIQAMAANATQTIEQGVTKVNNALTKYIGQTDEGLGASQRLVSGLNALADNFDTTADVVLKVAAVIASALVGRSIVGMIASLVLATTAVSRFVTALRAASTVGGIATAIGGLSAAAGPLGLLVGATVGALVLFSSTAEAASGGARTYAEALRRVEEAAKATAPAVDGVARSISKEMSNRISAGVDEGARKIEEARQAALNLFSTIIDNAPRRLVSEEQLTGLEDLRAGLKDGTVSAKEASERLYGLANSNPNFQRLADQMAPLLETLANAITATKNLKEQLASVQPPSFREAENASMSSLDKMVAAGQQFVSDATKRANLTKDQLALEKEIAEVRKEAAAAGVTLSDRQVTDLANTRIAGDAARSREGKAPKAIKATSDSRFDQDIQYVRDRTAALLQEQQLIGQGLAVQESRRLAIELEQQALADLREEARRKGEADLATIQLAPDQVAAIHDVADAYGQQAEALAKAQQVYADANDMARGFADDLTSGLLNGASAADALADALDNVADKILDMALDSLFDSGGGFLANLFNGFGFSGGGAVGFAAGGYTGAGGKYQPAGVVHRGEYVFDQAAVRAAGGPAALDAMRRGLKGYASGGFVGQAPRLPSLAGAASRRDASMTVTYAPQVSIGAGASVESVAALRKELADDRRQFAARTIRTIQDARRRNVPV